MKVLVTGVEGQVGSEMLRLAQDDLQIMGFDRRGLDVADAGQVEDRLNECAPDIVVNCAAYTSVDRAEDEPDVAYRANAEAVGILGRACAELDIGIVHLSTDYVFDGTKDGPYTEDDVPNPLGVYGASKLAGEAALSEATDKYVILRVSWVFGRVGRSFVDTILRLGSERDEISVVADQVGGPTPAMAIAQTILRTGRTVIERDSLWGTYHFAAAPMVSWFGFAQRIVATGVEAGILRVAPTINPIPSSEWPAKSRRPMNSRLHMAKLAAAFGVSQPGWEPYLRMSVAAHAELVSTEGPERASG